MGNSVALRMIVLVVFCACVFANDQCDEKNCFASNGSICNDKGTCDCGKCTCSGTYSGPTCEDCPTCPDACEVFKGCVGCKIFMTGPMGFMECLDKCDSIANFIPVDSKEFDANKNDGKKLCNHINERRCMESFRIGGMSGGYRDLYVRMDTNCDIPPPTTTTKMSVIEVDIKEENSNSKNNGGGSGYQSDKESAEAASGFGEIGSGNGASAAKMSLTVSVVCACICTMISRLNSVCFWKGIN